jgi:hypothetical protein
MGGGSWDSSAYHTATATRKATGTADFDYSVKVATGKVKGVHDTLDPAKVAGPTSPLVGQPVRESRDNADHPESLPIAVFFDVTGSMGHIPQKLQTKLASLMDVILSKAEVKDPQILVGAVGDSTCDRYPLQAGQFESDNRFDEALRNIIIESGGGGQNMESYALAYRFAAYHTATDSFEKRGKKGYFFTIGDEGPWPTVPASHVEKIFGVKTQIDETIEDLIAKASEKWEIYHIQALDGSCRPDSILSGRYTTAGTAKTDMTVGERWKSLLGERYVSIEDSSLICEFVAALVDTMETAKTIDTVINDDLGLTGHAASVVRNALVPIAGRMPAHIAAGNLPTTHGASPGTSGGGGVTKL